MVVQDYQGPSTISTTDLHLMYAYELHVSEHVTFRPALQVGFVRRKVDYSQLTLPEQFTDQGPTGAGIDESSLGASSILYPEVGAGGLFYTSRGWVGVGMNHLNQPNQSFYNEIARLPVKLSVTGGHKFYLKKVKFFAYMETEKEFSISPTFHYKSQGKSDQLDLGVYLVWDQIQGGLWYRGIPVKQYSRSLPNNEAIIPMIGYRYNNFTFSYSYDFTLSRLTPAKTYGAHEFNITYVNQVTKRKKPKILKRLPCPKF